MRKNYVVVDYNPDRIKTLELHKIPCIFGDISDIEFLESIKIEKSKMVVSTVADIGATTLLLNFMKEKNKDAIVIVTGGHVSEASKLYDLGADYVIIPHLLGGQYVADVIEKVNINKKKYLKERNNEMKSINERLKMGRRKN